MFGRARVGTQFKNLCSDGGSWCGEVENSVLIPLHLLLQFFVFFLQVPQKKSGLSTGMPPLRSSTSSNIFATSPVALEPKPELAPQVGPRLTAAEFLTHSRTSSSEASHVHDQPNLTSNAAVPSSETKDASHSSNKPNGSNQIGDTNHYHDKDQEIVSPSSLISMTFFYSALVGLPSLGWIALKDKSFQHFEAAGLFCSAPKIVSIYVFLTPPQK